MKSAELCHYIQDQIAPLCESVECLDWVQVTVLPENLLALSLRLRDDSALQFKQLSDLCGVDYQDYGKSYWRQESSTTDGYTRGVMGQGEQVTAWDKPRYAVVYHLLSHEFNMRLRIKVYLEPEPMLPSVIDIWPAANWYEREAFDLFGVFFEGHPDLRRIMTDYGFQGHPFRKDFPLIGRVEMRYDALKQACVYEPVSIQPRTLVPKVIREDNRYTHLAPEGDANA